MPISLASFSGWLLCFTAITREQQLINTLSITLWVSTVASHSHFPSEMNPSLLNLSVWKPLCISGHFHLALFGLWLLLWLEDQGEERTDRPALHSVLWIFIAILIPSIPFLILLSYWEVSYTLTSYRNAEEQFLTESKKTLPNPKPKNHNPWKAIALILEKILCVQNVSSRNADHLSISLKRKKERKKASS